MYPVTRCHYELWVAHTARLPPAVSQGLKGGFPNFSNPLAAVLRKRVVIVFWFFFNPAKSVLEKDTSVHIFVTFLYIFNDSKTVVRGLFIL